jgi:serine phosphatase RsbU (regulator of sigma subunit)
MAPRLHIRTKFERNLFIAIVLLAVAIAAVSMVSLFMARQKMQGMFSQLWESSGADLARDDLAYFARQRLGELSSAQARSIETALSNCSLHDAGAVLDHISAYLAQDSDRPQGLSLDRIELYRQDGETWGLAASRLADIDGEPTTAAQADRVSSHDIDRFVARGQQPTQRQVGFIQSLVHCPASPAGRDDRYIIAATAATDSAFTERWRRSRAMVDRPSFTIFFSDLVLSQSVWLLAAMLPILLIAIIVCRVLSARVSRPLADLVSAMDQVSRGNLSYRAPRVSQAEFGYLVDSFNEMTANIQRLNEETRHAARMKRELEMGREIQLQFLPKTLPRPAGYDLYGANISSLEVSGDFFDAFQHGGDGEIVLAIGDVCGKGIPAAMVMAQSLACLHTLSERGKEDLTDWVKSLNRLLQAATTETTFVTLFLAVLHAETKRLLYVNGGHNRPLLRRPDGKIEELDRGGPMIGILPEFPFQSGEVELKAGDVLLMYTDGITEAMDTAEEEFGEERLTAYLQNRAGLPAEDIALQLFAEVKSFTGLESQADDMTLLVLKVTDDGG